MGESGWRRLWFGALIALQVLAGIFPALPASARVSRPRDRATGPAAPDYDPGTVLVKLSRAHGGLAASILASHGLRGVDHVPGVPWIVASTERLSVHRALAALRADARIDAAEPNFIRSVAAVPNDHRYQKGTQDYLRLLRLPEAWSITDATGITIAVVDTGVDLDHPDLDDALVPGYDFVNDDPIAQDDHRHGTQVAGIAAAETNNAEGVSGVAWGARIMPLKVLDSTGAGRDSDLAAAISWAVDHGADVINMSLGGPSPSSMLHDAIGAATARGVVVVAAAGNYPNVISYPAAFPESIAVGATDWSGDLAWFSSTGHWVDVVAPGWMITTTSLADGPRSLYKGGYFSAPFGTSFAAPVVSGIAALMKASDPLLTPDAIANRLRGSALDVGPRGIDPYYGHGVVDAFAALGGLALPTSAQPRGDALEPNDVSDRAHSITTTAPTFATIAPEGDVDWYSADLPPGEYRLTVNPENYRDPRALGMIPAVRVLDQERRLVSREREIFVDGSMVHSFKAERSGRHYFEIRSLVGSRSAGAYSVKLETMSSVAPVPYRWFYDKDFLDASVISTAIGDVTGDGKSDVLATTENFDDGPHDLALVVYPQVDDGWFGTPQILPTSGLYWSEQGLDVGDIDGDGDTDAAVATGAGVDVFIQGPTGLGAAQTLPRRLSHQVEIADIGNDGDGDLLVNSYHFSEVAPDEGLWLLRNDGASWTHVQVDGAQYAEIEAADVTGDGRVDVVGNIALPTGSTEIRIHPQTLSGTFDAPSSVTAPQAVGGIAAGDVTNDGRREVVAIARDTSFSGTRGLYVFVQSTTGAMGSPVSYEVNSGGIAAEVGDVDGDGRLDVVAGTVMLQQADGTLATGGPGSSSGYRKGLALGDFTSDGYLDIAAANDAHWRPFPLATLRQKSPVWPRPEWIRSTTPAGDSAGAASTVAPSIRFGRDVDAASVSASSLSLEDASTGLGVAGTVSFDAVSDTATFRPSVALTNGRTYVLAASGVRDTLGNRPGYRFRFTVGPPPADTTVPDTFIHMTPLGTMQTTNDHRFDSYASEPGSRFQCRFSGGSWIDCQNPFAIAFVSDPKSFEVRAIDGAGNVDGSPARSVWFQSNDPPPNDHFDNALSISGEQGSVTGTTRSAWYETNNFTPSNSGGMSVWYRWSAPAGGTATFDTSGSDFDSLLGVYTGSSVQDLRLIADSDDFGESRSSRVTFAVTANTSYLIGVDGFSRGLYADNGDVVLNWSFVAGAGASPSPTSPSPTATTDPTVSPSATPTSDPTVSPPDAPPQVSMTAPSDGAFVSGAVTFTADASDDHGVASVEFLVEGVSVGSDGLAPFDASWDSRAIPDGAVTAVARATDVAGNVTDSAGVSLQVDNTAPDTTIVAGPSGTISSGSATFEFGANEAASSFECALDTSSFTPCSSPFTYSGLADGDHTFRVRATDRAGNVDDSPASRSFSVASASSGGGSAGGGGSTGGGGGGGAQPSPSPSQSPSPEPQPSPSQSPSPEPQPSPAPSPTETVDTIITSGPSGTTAATSAHFTFEATQPDAFFECRLDDAEFSRCSSPIDLSGLAAGEHSFSVRAFTDGSTDPTPAVRIWTIDPDQVAGTLIHSRSVSLRLRRHLVARGTVATSDSFAPCIERVPLRLQRRKSDGWRTVARARTRLDGTFRVEVPDRQGRYRVKAIELLRGTDDRHLCVKVISRVRSHSH